MDVGSWAIWTIKWFLAYFICQVILIDLHTLVKWLNGFRVWIVDWTKDYRFFVDRPWDDFNREVCLYWHNSWLIQNFHLHREVVETYISEISRINCDIIPIGAWESLHFHDSSIFCIHCFTCVSIQDRVRDLTTWTVFAIKFTNWVWVSLVLVMQHSWVKHVNPVQVWQSLIFNDLW